MSGEPARTTTRVFFAVLTAVAVLAGVALLFTYRFIVLAVLTGVGLGVLLVPLLRMLQRRARLPRGVSAILLVILLAGALFGGGYGLFALFSDQLESLIVQAPTMAEKLEQQVDEWEARFPILSNIRDGFDPAAMLQNVGKMLLVGVRTGMEVVTGGLVILFLAVFIAINADSYLRGFLSLFPPGRRARIEAIGDGAARVLRRWFVGQLVVMSITGVLTAVALWIIGIDYWLLIGFMTGLFDFIPFIGAFLTGAAAVLVTLGTEPDKVWLVLATYVVIQQVESDLTLPLVMRGGLHMPEAHLLVIMLLMGSAFGLAGLFVAPPLFAVLLHVYREAYLPWIDQRGPVST